jgi:hypothetical protein
MKLISHRRNSIAELRATDHKYGVEVDIRSEGQKLIIHHDPFVAGESFDEWVDSYQHGTLILNVKEEGLEARLIALMASKGIDDYFFLDQSFPFLVKWSKAGEHHCAVGFKLCLVSPELQGRNAEIEIPALVSLLSERNIKSDAVCTKRPDLWEKMANTK